MRFFVTTFRSLPFLLLVFCLCGAAFAQTDPGTLPLTLMPGKTFADVQAQASLDARSSPKFSNSPTTLPFHITLSGSVTADATTTKLAIHSDDGCDVYVNGVKVWSSLDTGQALPDLPNSLHELPLTMTPGQTYTVRIDYSNIIYFPPDPTTGQPLDIDGCTLFVYGGSGNIVTGDPIVTVIGGDPGDPDIGQTNTCPVNATVDHLPAGHDPANLTATWTWTMGTTVWTPFPADDGSTPPPDTSTFAVTLSTFDNLKSTGTFTGKYQSEGYFLLPVTASVTYHDSSTGKDIGPFPAAGPATGYVGDIQDDPNYDPAADTSGSSASGSQDTPHIAISPMIGTNLATKAPRQHVVSGLKVTLSTHLIKLGLYSANHTTETDSATVIPTFAASYVSFNVTKGEASVTPTILYKVVNGKNVPTGVINLVVTAIKATPADSAYAALGDAFLIVKGNNMTKDKANLIVYEPEQTGFPYPKNVTDQPVVGKRLIIDNGTSPGTYGLPAGVQFEITFYGLTQTIPVWDQFAEPLNSLYDGTPVTENGNPINQNISNGTYLDNIGLSYHYSSISTIFTTAEEKKKYLDTTPETFLEAIISKAAYVGYPTSFPYTGNYDTAVEVGGKSLDPAIKGRVLTFKAVPAIPGSPGVPPVPEQDTVTTTWTGY